jgi:hypothetical protein
VTGRSRLNLAGQATLSAAGAGTVSLGPQQSAGPANWDITGVVLLSSRPGVSPIPKASVYLDTIDANGLQGVSYDGSFAQGAVRNLLLRRGSLLIAVWSGGLSGDIVSMTVTGEKW